MIWFWYHWRSGDNTQENTPQQLSYAENQKIMDHLINSMKFCCVNDLNLFHLPHFKITNYSHIITFSSNIEEYYIVLLYVLFGHYKPL